MAVAEVPRSTVAALAAALLICAASLAAGQAVELAVSERGGALAANLTFRWDRTTDIVDSLGQGLESRITFTVRVYEKRQGALPFIGDRLLAQKIVARSAFKSFLDNRFVVESDAGIQQSYENPEELLRQFFAIVELPLYAISPSAHRPLFVTARAQFEPVRLMPPLTLVTIMGEAAAWTTAWTRKEVP